MTYLPEVHTEEETRGWIRGLVLEEQEVWVADDGKQVVGFAALGDGLLEHLYVAPERQRQGVGTELFHIATRRRPDGFRLWIFQKNLGAWRFYERLGCRVVELTDGSGNEEREPDALFEWRPEPV